MAKYELGFLGAGNMAEGIVGGVLRRQVLAAGQILASDPLEDRRRIFREQFGIGLGVDTAAPYEIVWNTASVADGSHQVKAVATDTINQTGQDINTVTVSNIAPVDNPPTVTITNPADGATVNGTINITASASDDKGVTQVEFFLDNVSMGVDTAAPYQMSWNTTTAMNGSHQVKAVATDTINQTGVDVNSVTVNNTAASNMHIGDLDKSATGTTRWNATVTIYVHDANHQPVAGVVVTGNWTGGATGTSSCTTDSTGKCTVTKSSIARNKTSITFTVTSASKTGWTYTSTNNHDPDGDSTGTAITVNRPY